jgi:hypothetical protein
MELNQVHFVAVAVSSDLQQIIDALEPRFERQIGCDVGEGNRLNRIHDDEALVHAVTAAQFYMGTCPYANAACDYSLPDAVAKALCEHHMNLICQFGGGLGVRRLESGGHEQG